MDLYLVCDQDSACPPVPPLIQSEHKMLDYGWGR